MNRRQKGLCIVAAAAVGALTGGLIAAAALCEDVTEARDAVTDAVDYLRGAAPPAAWPERREQQPA